MYLCWQVFEVAPSLYMVELRKSNGDTLEYHNVSVHVNANAILLQMHSMASADTHIWEAIIWK